MIGVFDSGHGGLTVLRALVERLPERVFLYLGDHRHAPYGERGAPEIHDLTRTNVARLFHEGCQLVLLACNTAAAVALRRLQQEWLPGAPREPSVVGVLATRRTVESGAYAREIARRAPAVRVVQQACPGLVARIEDGAAAETLAAAIDGHVVALMDQLDGRAPDSVILGCTHYPLVAGAFAAALPAGVPLHSQPALVARFFGAALNFRTA